MSVPAGFDRGGAGESGEPRALEGIRIAITRAAEQAGPLADRLRALGASVADVGLIRIVDPADGGVALLTCVENLHTYEWVVFTSPNAARRFLDAVSTTDAGCAAISGAAERIEGARPKVAAIGPGTAAVVRECGWTVDLVPQRSIGEGLAEAFPRFAGRTAAGRTAAGRTAAGRTAAEGTAAEGTAAEGTAAEGTAAERTAAGGVSPAGRVLFPRAAIARPVVLDALIAKGWDVTVVEAYRTLPVEITEAHVAILREAQIIVLTSSSTATVTANALAIGRDIEDVKAQEGPRRHQLTPPIVSMGVATTATAFDRGMPITITADPSTLDGLINACVTVAQSVYPRQP